MEGRMSLEAEYGPSEWPALLSPYPRHKLPSRALHVLAWHLGAGLLDHQARERFVTPFKVAKLKASALEDEYNFGRRSLRDVRLWLSQYGLKLAE